MVKVFETVDIFGSRCFINVASVCSIQEEYRDPRTVYEKDAPRPVVIHTTATSITVDLSVDKVRAAIFGLPAHLKED